MKTDNSQVQFLLMGEKKRVNELRKSGLRKPKFLRLYCSYTVDSESVQASDWIEKILAKIESQWNKWSGGAAVLRETQYEELLDKAFTDGFIRWEQLLTTKMGLIVEPMDEIALWHRVWERFNSSTPIELPQLTVFGENGIEETSTSDLHLTTHLFPTSDSIPYPDRAFVHIKGQYVAPVVFIDKPGGWANKESQLRYLWEFFSREAVYDTEVFCQLSRANSAIIKENITRVTKQAIAAQNESSKNASVDVGAAIRQRKAIAAQEELYEGALPLNVATVFVVHRESLDDLDSACRYLQNCFRRPAWVDRETEYAWKIWLQTLPICWEKLLSHPFERRLNYLTGEAPAFMSLVQPSPVDKRGIEVISDEGGVPIFIDLFKQHRNIAYFATTRAGKSVKIAGTLLQALANGLPITIIDFPPSDAASTFKDFTHYLGGSYFDIGKEASNLLELPNLDQFSPKEREERMTDFKEFVCSALMIMSFGSGEATTSDDRLLKQAIRSVLVPAVDRFYAEGAIITRYECAKEGGLGSTAWENIPTLTDFADFFETKALTDIPVEVLRDPNTQRAINQIKRQLRFWITSRVGRAIARPSTIDAKAQMLVFALRGLSDSDDAAILALSAYGNTIRNTLSHPESICFIDEFSVLLEWDEIGHLIARLCANGAKAGIRVILGRTRSKYPC